MFRRARRPIPIHTKFESLSNLHATVWNWPRGRSGWPVYLGSLSIAFYANFKIAMTFATSCIRSLTDCTFQYTEATRHKG